MGATAAAAVIIKKEKRIVEAFRQAGATSPGAAVNPDALGVHQRLAFRKLKAGAALRETGPGLFYLDEPSWEAMRSFRRRVALVIGLFVLLLAVLGTFARPG
jgi:hypothetical protein